MNRNRRKYSIRRTEGGENHISCPKCFGPSIVWETRKASYLDSSGRISCYRIRKCLRCGYHFTTKEIQNGGSE